MKNLFTLAIVLISHFSFSQSDEITIPQNTLVHIILNEDVREGKNKVGDAAKFVVAEDVVINNNVAIAKGALVHATITSSKRGDLRVDLYDVAAVDGTIIKLDDCWIFTTAAQNTKSHGALIIKGTRKNCVTPVSYTIKKTTGKY